MSLFEHYDDVCRTYKGIAPATYSGIGGCGEAQIQTYLLKTNTGFWSFPK